jgi:hypothetical protein
MNLGPDMRRSSQPIPSGFEEAIGGILGGAFFGHGRLQPVDFRIHERDALGKFFNGQQRQVLSDFVADFLSWLVVILDGHALAPCSTISEAVASRGAAG